jgi:hypothetical protein
MEIKDDPEFNSMLSHLPEPKAKRIAANKLVAKNKHSEVVRQLEFSDFSWTRSYGKVYEYTKGASLHVGASKLLNNPDVRNEIVEFLSGIDRSFLSIEENINIESLYASIMKKELKNGV